MRVPVNVGYSCSFIKICGKYMERKWFICKGSEKKDLEIVQNVSLLSKMAGRVLQERCILMIFAQTTTLRPSMKRKY